MIDLHLHTNASDGRCTPADVVARASAASLSVISVTDHDTVSALREVAAHGVAAGVRVIPGIEITAVWHDLDVHVLGYFLNIRDPRLVSFLERQRADRLRRVTLMLARLAHLGMAVDEAAVFQPVAGRAPDAVGRPQVARALVQAGHAADTNDAFARFLGEGRPAYVPRIGALPADVVKLVRAAGGVASLAHPAILGHDEIIGEMVAAGMQAIEVYHPDHDATAVDHYRDVARRYRLVATGGSDYHGDGEHGASALGVVTLPGADLARLEALGERD
ncbi:MAG: PHP domain-containing protein [Bacteroidales bacterium]